VLIEAGSLPKITSGKLAPEDPIVLGCDVAGVVMATGPGVTRFCVGDEVYGCAGGVFDTVGGPNIALSIEALAIDGRCATIVSIGAQPDLTGLHMKNASLLVVFMLIPMLTGQGLERHGTIMERVSALADHGRIKPLLDDSRCTLTELEAAHEQLTSGRAVGKVVVDIG
jgi:NADPH:quinone reductase-like Zn-dependent oxidoreductase